MDTVSGAIISFDDAGNLDLFGHDEILSQVFLASDRVQAFRATLSDFKTFSRCCPEMVELIDELLPSMPEYVADLPEATLKLMKDGKLFLRPDKNGRLLATLVNADNQRIDRIVRLKEVQQAPAVSDMMFSLSFMAITQQLNEIQESIAEIRQAQINDRETYGMVAAQKLQWAAIESDQEKRQSLCGEAHAEAVKGFFACLNTVKESADFFLSQPSSDNLPIAVLRQTAPWNWGKTLTAITQMRPKSVDLQRAVAKCTYCAQYASASSFMRGDEPQAIRDLDMYAEHMSRTVLGEKAERLRLWLSPSSLEGLPILKQNLSGSDSRSDDILSYVERTVTRINSISTASDALLNDASRDPKSTRRLPEE